MASAQREDGQGKQDDGQTRGWSSMSERHWLDCRRCT
jgi:hypothetical protein